MNRNLLLLALLATSLQSFAQDLPRRAFLGIQLTSVSDSLTKQLGLAQEAGVLVQRVFPQSSAAAAELQSGDIITKMDQHEVQGVADFLATIRQYQPGDEVRLTLWREGKKMKQVLPLKSMPKEEYEHAEIEYGAVEGPSGTLRSILTIPTGASGPVPVLYIVQGIDCGSVDLAFAPQSSFRRLIEAAHKRGFATYRIEKSGVGDSKGKSCRDCDFMEDAEGFLAGLRQLKQHASINGQGVFLLGISMGGVWAPWMASQEEVAGIIAYGTISRPFKEYLLENFRRQAILGESDFVMIEQSMKNDARLYHYLFEAQMSPEEVIEKHPDLAGRVRQISSETGEGPIEHLFAGRTYQFHAQLQRLNVSECWSLVNAPVLAVWGKGDYVSNRADHILIENIVNFYHPGMGTFVEVEANHWFETAVSQQEAFDARARNESPPYNEEVFDLFLDWMEEVG